MLIASAKLNAELNAKLNAKLKLMWVGLAFIIGVVVVLAGLLSLGTGSYGWRLPPAISEPVARVRLCVPQFASSALVAVAQAQGYFLDEKLNVDLDVQELGFMCVQAMTDGKTDFAVAYLTPFAKAVVDGAPLVVLTEVHSSIHNTSIVFSSQRSRINSPKDLAGKRIALVPGTNAENLLNLYLMAHGLPRSEIVEIEATQNQIPLLLHQGLADAAVAWEPMVTRIKKLGDAGEYRSLESSFYTEFSVLFTRAEKKPDPAAMSIQTRLVKALFRAQNFIKAEPKRARELTAEVLKMNIEEMTPEVWNKYRLFLGLSAVLNSMFEEEAALIKQAQKNEAIPTSVPYFSEPLVTVAPELVTLK